MVHHSVTLPIDGLIEGCPDGPETLWGQGEGFQYETLFPLVYDTIAVHVGQFIDQVGDLTGNRLERGIGEGNPLFSLRPAGWPGNMDYGTSLHALLQGR